MILVSKAPHYGPALGWPGMYAAAQRAELGELGAPSGHRAGQLRRRAGGRETSTEPLGGKVLQH